MLMHHMTHVSFCPLIWDTLCRGIQKTIEILRYLQLAPKLAFLCKCENTQPHLALPADAFNYWTCELNPDTVYGHLTPEHFVWCPEKGNKTNLCVITMHVNITLNLSTMCSIRLASCMYLHPTLIHMENI